MMRKNLKFPPRGSSAKPPKITCNNVKTVLKSLKQEKSPGPNGIPPILLEEISYPVRTFSRLHTTANVSPIWILDWQSVWFCFEEFPRFFISRKYNSTIERARVTLLVSRYNVTVKTFVLYPNCRSLCIKLMKHNFLQKNTNRRPRIGVRPILLKELEEEISYPPTNLLQNSLDSGRIPRG